MRHLETDELTILALTVPKIQTLWIVVRNSDQIDVGTTEAWNRLQRYHRRTKQRERDGE